MKEMPPGVQKPHTLMVDNRMHTVVTGVEKVELFNGEMISAFTSFGSISLQGQGLHVESLDLAEGRLIVTGKIERVEYDESARKAKGVIARIFK